MPGAGAVEEVGLAVAVEVGDRERVALHVGRESVRPEVPTRPTRRRTTVPAGRRRCPVRKKNPHSPSTLHIFIKQRVLPRLELQHELAAGLIDRLGARCR